MWTAWKTLNGLNAIHVQCVKVIKCLPFEGRFWYFNIPCECYGRVLLAIRPGSFAKLKMVTADSSGKEDFGSFVMSVKTSVRCGDKAFNGNEWMQNSSSVHLPSYLLRREALSGPFPRVRSPLAASGARSEKSSPRFIPTLHEGSCPPKPDERLSRASVRSVHPIDSTWLC